MGAKGSPRGPLGKMPVTLGRGFFDPGGRPKAAKGAPRAAKERLGAPKRPQNDPQIDKIPPKIQIFDIRIAGSNFLLIFL